MNDHERDLGLTLIGAADRLRRKLRPDSLHSPTSRYFYPRYLFDHFSLVASKHAPKLSLT